MNPDYKLKLVIGYLESPDLAREWSTSTPISIEGLLSWTCRTLSEPRARVLAGRYRTIEKIDEKLLGFPWDSVLMEKVLIPIHQAKVAFVMGHELGCIALCGMVGEMLAVFRYDISNFASAANGAAAESERQKRSLKFEDLGQSHRVRVLEVMNLIDRQTAEKFSELAAKRNKWLHRLSAMHDTLSVDAVKSYQIVCELTDSILRSPETGERFNLNSDVLRYLMEEREKEGAATRATGEPRP